MSAEDHIEKALFEKYASECDSRADRIKLCKAYLEKYDPSKVRTKLPFTQETEDHSLTPVFDKRIVKSETLHIEHFDSDYDMHKRDVIEIARDIRHAFAEKINDYIVVKSYKDMARAGTVHRFTLGVWK